MPFTSLLSAQIAVLKGILVMSSARAAVWGRAGGCCRLRSRDQPDGGTQRVTATPNEHVPDNTAPPSAARPRESPVRDGPGPAARSQEGTWSVGWSQPVRSWGSGPRGCVHSLGPIMRPLDKGDVVRGRHGQRRTAEREGGRGGGRGTGGAGSAVGGQLKIPPDGPWCR